MYRPPTILTTVRRIATHIKEEIEKFTQISYLIEQVAPRTRRKHRRRWRPERNIDLLKSEVIFSLQKKSMRDRPNNEDLCHDWSYAVYLHDLRIYVSTYNAPPQELKRAKQALQAIANLSKRVIVLNIVTRRYAAKQDVMGAHTFVPRKRPS